MKRLGMTAQIHSRPLIQGALMHVSRRAGVGHAADPAHPGQRHPLGPRLRRDRGDDLQPVLHLCFAVTGKMVGGHKVNRQTITREEALIAHTRNNAFFVFQESNLGSLQNGKYADLLVLDRDYLTVPEDAIKDLKPVMTMVGGKVVYERKANSHEVTRTQSKTRGEQINRPSALSYFSVISVFSVAEGSRSS